MIGGTELAFADLGINVKPGSGLVACQASFLNGSASRTVEAPALAAV
jgi:hypothetical protein